MKKKVEIIISCAVIGVNILNVVVQVTIGRVGLLAATVIILGLIGSIIGAVWLTLILFDDEGETNDEKSGSSEEHKEASEKKDEGDAEEESSEEGTDEGADEAATNFPADEPHLDMSPAKVLIDELDYLKRSNRKMKILAGALIGVTIAVIIVAIAALSVAKKSEVKATEALVNSKTAIYKVEKLEPDLADLKRENIIANGQAEEVDMIEFLESQGARNIYEGFTEAGGKALFFRIGKRSYTERNFRLVGNVLEVEVYGEQGAYRKLGVHSVLQQCYVDRYRGLTLTADEFWVVKNATEFGED